ncbi:MAG: hypothetical protein CM1200mP16_01230 [Nitrospina sp.]|nr:MAG: hypothetical protein CM1200mP16_01230 [Nitrospina sp.]
MLESARLPMRVGYGTWCRWNFDETLCGAKDPLKMSMAMKMAVESGRWLMKQEEYLQTLCFGE